MEASQGAGNYIANGQAKIYDNAFENLNTTVTGGAVYVKGSLLFFTMRSGGFPWIYNSEDTLWKWFNAPEESVSFVENTEQDNNRYDECTVNNDSTAEGAKIGHSQMITSEGTLSLHPEEGQEQNMVTMTIDYQIGTAFKGGTLTIHVPTGFEITDKASVTIEGQLATAASHYNPTTQTIDITVIDLDQGTITLKLEEQKVPDGVTAEENSKRDVDYTFRSLADADGAGTAWSESTESEAVFTSTPLSTNTDFKLTGDDPRLIQYKSDLLQPVAIQSRPTPEATVLKVASETTVETVLNNSTNVDGATQSYKIYNSESDSLSDSATLTKPATLVVTSEHGAPYEQEYAIEINVTLFVRLEKTQEILSSSRNN